MKIFAFVLLVAFPSSSSAFCFDKAGQMYGVHPDIIRSIANVENPSKNPKAVNWNSDGSYDYGLMQVNSIWAKEIGPNLWRDQSDPCTNVMTATWILAGCLRSYGYTWKGIGCYHSRTPKHRNVYVEKIAKQLNSINKTKVLK